ncbi:MAG: hypothetical protein WKF43_17770 [Acidimicrobiales bacterium]
MLFPQRFWDGLADGTTTLAFRRWRRPAARAGSRHRYPRGVLSIDRVEVVEPEDLTEGDARRAGYEHLDELRASLVGRPGDLYRIELHHSGEDERIDLRQRNELGAEELDAIRRRLERLDVAGGHGPWTRAVLVAIHERPATRAADLAALFGRDKPAFKADVRKLKQLGLTESLDVGYRLSPRGRAVLTILGTQAR